MPAGPDSAGDSPVTATAGSMRPLEEAEARMHAGDAEGGRRLLQRAARAGDPPAAVQLAVWEMVGLGGPVDVVAASVRLREVADRGHARANALYAQLVAAGEGGLPRDDEEAKARLIAAAERGDPGAAMQLAVLIPNVPAAAVVRTALMRAAASGGEPISRMFLERSPPSPPSPRIDWQDVRAGVSMPHERPLPAPESCSERPRIACLRGLFTADECIYVALKGLPLLRPARIVERDGSAVVDAMRSNEAAKFGLLETDVVVRSLDRRVAAALGHPAENGEGFALLRYQAGQQYLPHCDWIDPARDATRADLEQWGQRVATCVVYLNDAFTGGTTAFPRLGLEFRGGVGDAFVWDNVLPTGDVDPLTLHAGRPPTQGMKYLLSKWMRDRSQVGNLT